jgi:hypothetical protein
MKTVNKTFKNIEIGDSIAFGNTDGKGFWVGKRWHQTIDPSAKNYALPVQNKVCIVEFLEVVEFGKIIEGNPNRQEILFSDGQIHTLRHGNEKYITEVK